MEGLKDGTKTILDQAIARSFSYHETENINRIISKTMKVTRYKNCYCWTCKKDFHYLGIARHRTAHLDRDETCKITYTNGETYIHGRADKDNSPS